MATSLAWTFVKQTHIVELKSVFCDLWADFSSCLNVILSTCWHTYGVMCHLQDKQGRRKKLCSFCNEISQQCLMTYKWPIFLYNDKLQPIVLLSVPILLYDHIDFFIFVMSSSNELPLEKAFAFPKLLQKILLSLIIWLDLFLSLSSFKCSLTHLCSFISSLVYFSQN